MNDVSNRIAPRGLDDIRIREYRDEDESEVLRLLDAALGGGPAGSRTSEFFRWKHLANPFGRSYMALAEAEGRIVGLRAFMRWEFVTAGRRLRAVRAVDTATHPDFQGKGIFSMLTRRALQDLTVEADLIFNTPNAKSLPGYLKMGWRIVGRMPVYVRLRRPIRFAMHVRSLSRVGGTSGTTLEATGLSASEALALPGVERLIRTRQAWRGIETARDIEFLRWRYGIAPQLGYRAVVASGGDHITGLAIFRNRPRGDLIECTVSEVISEFGDRKTPRRLLTEVSRSSKADHLTCMFPRATTLSAAARRAGFLRAPEGVTFVVNPLGHRIDPDPLDMSSWSQSVGDVEVF